MKTWMIPEATAQQFAANDYVSACTLQIMCDFTLPKGAAYAHVLSNNTVDFDGDGKIEGNTDGFEPCGKLHNAKTDTEFSYYEFTSGWTSNMNTVTFDAPVKLAYWREMDESGKVVNVHVTAPENILNAEANKS